MKPTRTHNEAKAWALAKDWGFTSPETLFQQYIWASIMPGICMNVGCNYTTDVEPDQTRGFCESCRTRTVKSIAELI